MKYYINNFIFIVKENINRTPTCEVFQTFINYTRTTGSNLLFNLTWSRNGDGDLVVKTPLGKMISRMNKGPNNSTDCGQFGVDITSGMGAENIFWSNDTIPPTGLYYICAVPYYFSPSVSTYNPVTFTVEARTPPSKVQIYTRTMRSSSNDYNSCDNFSDMLITSFAYP